MSRALQVALGGSLLALVGGGAGLVHVDRQRRSIETELTGLRQELAESEDAAQRAARLRLQVSALTQQASRQAAELAQGRERVVELAEALRALREAAGAELRAAEAAQREALTEALTEARARAAEREAELETALASARGQTQALEGELARQTEALDAERERGQLLATTLRERERSLSQQAAELRQALAQLDALDAQLADTRARALAAEQTLQIVRDAGVNVGRLTGDDPMPAVRAKVVKVDLQALPPVLLVDVGSQHGIAVGDELSVLRDGREVARLEVAEVRERLSSARLLQADRNLRLRPGDAVSSRAVRRK